MDESYFEMKEYLQMWNISKRVEYLGSNIFENVVKNYRKHQSSILQWFYVIF